MSTIFADKFKNTSGGNNVKVNQLSGIDTAGSILVTGEGNSTTTNLQQGLAKAWANTSGVGTPAIADSFNMASVTDLGTGAEKFTFTNAMSNINFSTQALTDHNTQGVTVQQVPDYANTTTTSSISTVNVSGTATDTDKSILIHGDLA